MNRGILGVLVVGLLLLVGCGGQSADPLGIDGVWENTQSITPSRLEIDGNQFTMINYNRHQNLRHWLSVYENDPGFDEIEPGEIDSGAFFRLTGRNINDGADGDLYEYAIELILESEWATTIERIPTQRKTIWFMKAGVGGEVARTAQAFEEMIELYEHEPGFAIAENSGITQGEDMDFDTFYLLTGTAADETYVYRIRVLSVDTRDVYKHITGYVRNFSIDVSFTTRQERYGTFTLLNDGRKEVVWGDTGNVQISDFDRTPNTITFSWTRYQRAD